MTDAQTQISPPMAALSAHMAAAATAPLAEAVAAKTKHHILDSLAAMVSGTRLKPGRLAAAYVAELGGNEEAQIPGTGILTTARNAALAGGMCAHADETDDSHPSAFFHPGCAIVPAALAMAERAGAPGAQLISAVALGYDVGARINLALDVDRFYGENNFSTHSFGALFGAAAAAGAVARLDAAGTRHRTRGKGLRFRRHGGRTRRRRRHHGRSRHDRAGGCFFRPPQLLRRLRRHPRTHCPGPG
jgi:2-methylcitrate dehydratase PrpD